MVQDLDQDLDVVSHLFVMGRDHLIRDLDVVSHLFIMLIGRVVNQLFIVSIKSVGHSFYQLVSHHSFYRLIGQFNLNVGWSVSHLFVHGQFFGRMVGRFVVACWSVGWSVN